MKRHYSHLPRAGLTRIEVVVLLIVIMLMLALLFPFLAYLRDRNHLEGTRQVQCINNMKQLALAMNISASVKGEFLPAQWINKQGEGDKQFSWRVALLPYMERIQVYDDIVNNAHDGKWMQISDKAFPFFICPVFSNLPPRHTPHQVIVGPETPFEGNRRSKIDDFERGLSHTILIAEASRSVPWMEPTDLPYENLEHGVVPLKSQHWSVGSGHRSGANVAMPDGSVRTLVFSQKPEDVAMLKQMTWLKEPKTQPHEHQLEN